MKILNVEEILTHLKEFNNNDLSHYTTIMKTSFLNTDPVFMKPKYIDFFWHCASTVPGWIGDVVLANAEAESQGSKKLLNLWKATTVNKEIEDSILYHAKDESRHSHLFIKLVSLAFPQSNSVETLLTLRSSLTKIKTKDLVKEAVSVPDNVLLDHLIQMNMGEIRTLIHMHFLGPVIFAMTPKENKDKVHDILQGLAKDEVVHIGYTSKLIEDWCLDNNYQLAQQIFRDRLFDFHKLTILQTEDTIKKYGQNNYPELLEI